MPELHERGRQRPRDLRLREPETVGDVLLREVAVEPQRDDLALSPREQPERALQRQPRLAAAKLRLGLREQRCIVVERRRCDRAAPRLVAPQLPDDRRDGVRAEIVTALDVEPVDGLDQADRARLREVVGLLGRAREATRECTDERQVPLDRLVPRRAVVGIVVPREQLERVEGRCQSSSTPTFTSSLYTGVELV